MFNQSPRKIGRYCVNPSHDSLHQKQRGAVERRFRYFQNEAIEKQKESSQNAPRDISAVELYRAALKQCPSISIDRRRQGGLPCIGGTRIPVHLVLWTIEHSGSIEGALKAYPDLTTEQVKDAIYFAETVLGSDSVLEHLASSD